MIIMLVANNQNELSCLRRFVEECYKDGRILEFRDAQEALAYAKCHPIDLLFTEIVMKYVSGFALSKVVRNQNLNTRVIFIADSQDYALAARKANINDYLLKPISKRSVEHTLQAC